MAKLRICSLYDIEANIPELYSKENDQFTEAIGSILNNIEIFSKKVLGRLSDYFGTDLEVTPYLTFPIARLANADKNSFLRTPELTAVEATLDAQDVDTFVISFTDSSNYTISSFLSGVKVDGSIGVDVDYASLFTVKADNWSGNFGVGDKFYFAFERYEELLRLLTIYEVADSLLSSRFVSEAANTMQSVQQSYRSKADTLYKGIVISGEIKLECTKEGMGGPPQSNETWHGYNIDQFGLEQDPPTGVDRDFL